MSSDRWSRVSNEPLDAKHLGLVLQELVAIQHKWKLIGAVLGLSKADLERIEQERYNRSSDCLLEMLDKWLKNGYDTALYGEPSWHTLVTRIDNTIDDKTCLKQIQEKYSSSEEPRATVNVDSDDESMASGEEDSGDEDGDNVDSCTSIQSTENQLLCWPFHCGCGHCTEDSLAQCPQRAKSDEVQLFATITSCTLATAEATNSLSTEVRLIEKEFQLLCWKTWNLLRKVDLKDIAGFLSVHLQDLWKLSREDKEKLRLKFDILKNHTELLKIIGSYISWYNYHLLQVLASLFLQTSEALLIVSWDAYEEKIQELHARFIQTSDNVIQFGSAQDDTSSVLVLKLTHSSFPLQLMRHIQEILGKDLGISPHLFHLVSVDASRLEATYKLHPQKLVIQEEFSSEFTDAGVTDIKYDTPSVQWKLKKSGSTQSLSKVLRFRNILSSKGIDADSKWSENNSTALHRACWRGHKNEVEWTVKRFDYNRFHCGRKGWTPAHAAVWGGHLDTLRYLLEDCSTSPTVCDNDHVSLLHVAAYKGHTDIARYLVSKCQLNPSAPDINDVTPILQAIHGGSVETFEALMSETDSTSVKQVTKHGVVAMLLACKSGNIVMLDKVVSIGGIALLNEVDNQHQSCLHYAVCSNNHSVIRHTQRLLNVSTLPLPLVTELARISAMYCSDEIISELVYMIKREDIIELLDILCEGLRLTRDEMQCHLDVISACNDTTAINRHSVPIKKQLDQAHVMMILIKEAELDGTNITRTSHSMCSSGNIQAVQLLREKFDINLNGINDVGESTLHQAAASGSTYLLKYMQSLDIKSNINDSSHHGDLPIHKACMSGSCNAIDFLAKQRENTLQKRNKEGLTPMLVACKHGHYNEAVLLVERYNCQLKESDKHGFNCLHYAALCGNKKLFMYLLEQNMSIRNAATDGSDVLHFATASGNLSLVKYLIEVHHCSPTKENAQGRQPIHIASQRGHKHVFKYLWMEENCDVRAADNDGFMPLHIACLGGHLHLVTYLTEKLGFNIRKIDGNPYQLVHLACESGCLPLVKSLIKNGCNPCSKIRSGTTSLHRACLSHNVALIKWLISVHRCDQNIKTRSGVRPIYWACAKGCLEVVKYLIEVRHCDVRFKTKEGYTCLHVASRHGHINVVKYLDGRSKCSIKYSGETVLHEAAMGGHITLVHHLISFAHCDPSAKCINHGRTCLHYAVEYGHLHLVKFLVSDHGVKVDAQDNEGATPLHIAALTNQLEILQYLVNIGRVRCSTTITTIADHHDSTLLHYAASSGCLDIARYLVEGGLPHDQHNKQGRTPLHDAEKNGQKDTVQYLKSLRISYI